MRMPSWAPTPLAEWLESYIKHAEEHGPRFVECEGVPELKDIWCRLLTRPEMEVVWKYIEEAETSLSLTSNGGLLGTVNRAIEYYISARRISPAHYKEEMADIASLAEALARKIKNYSSANSFGLFNPFPIDSLMSKDQLFSAGKMLRSDFLEPSPVTGVSRTATALNWHLPAAHEILEGLARRASNESEHQSSRLRLPTKTKGATVFRTYFARYVADWLVMHRLDYSPTKIATFCSVALDDPDLTPDLIRKICPLDPDMRDMFERLAIDRARPED